MNSFATENRRASLRSSFSVPALLMSSRSLGSTSTSATSTASSAVSSSLSFLSQSATSVVSAAAGAAAASSTTTSTDPNVAALQQKIRDTRQQRQQALLQQEQELEDIQHGLERATDAFDKAHEAFHRDISIAQYTSAIKEKNPQLPAYVLVLQSKVLRNVHHLCVVDAQLRLLEEQSNEMMAMVKQQARRTTEEGTEVEKDLLSSLVEVQRQETDLRDSFRDVLHNQCKTTKQLQKSISMSLESTVTQNTADMSSSSLCSDGQDNTNNEEEEEEQEKEEDQQQQQEAADTVTKAPAPSRLDEDTTTTTTNTNTTTNNNSPSDLDNLVDHLEKLNRRLSRQTVALERKESLNIEDDIFSNKSNDANPSDGQNKSFVFGDELDTSIRRVSERLRNSFSHMLWNNGRNEMVSI